MDGGGIRSIIEFKTFSTFLPFLAETGIGSSTSRSNWSTTCSITLSGSAAGKSIYS